MKPSPMSQQRQLWPTTMGVYQWADAPEVNPLLVRVLGALRATGQAASGQTGPFFASGDDLLQRIKIPEWQRLVQFLVNGIRDTVAVANAGAWDASHGEQPGMQIAIEGVWCQFSNHAAHHDVHTHGNCSWSGVYYVDLDDEAERIAHPGLGELNGITRFYGPYFNRLGGAHADFGNAYLQVPHTDIAPESGKLVVFPSWLPHQAMPYVGQRDRLIVSFNASVHSERGHNQLHAYQRG